MNAYTLHINLCDLAFLRIIFIGLTFILLLWFTKNVNRKANLYLEAHMANILFCGRRVSGWPRHKKLNSLHRATEIVLRLNSIALTHKALWCHTFNQTYNTMIFNVMGF